MSINLMGCVHRREINRQIEGVTRIYLCCKWKHIFLEAVLWCTTENDPTHLDNQSVACVLMLCRMIKRILCQYVWNVNSSEFNFEVLINKKLWTYSLMPEIWSECKSINASYSEIFSMLVDKCFPTIHKEKGVKCKKRYPFNFE